MITGLRKFIFSLIVFGTTCGLLIGGMITSDNFVTVTLAVLIIYTSGNVLSGVGGKVAQNLSVEVKSQEVKQP